MAEAEAPPPEKTIYAATSGRKTFFSFMFLILLPFFTSLWPMFFMRLKAGLVSDALGHAIMAVAFSILMFIVLIELVFSLRARIVLGEKELHLTLPAGRGPTPALRYRSYDIPYDQIQTVETRREIYGGSVVPVMLKGARIITKGNETIPLGYISEANLDPAFPLPEIAGKIAERARLPLIDRGSVWRSVRRKFLGWPKHGLIEADTVDETQIARLNDSHRNVVVGLVGLLGVLMLVGIVEDFSSDLPVGQTSAPIVESAPQKAPAGTPPSKPKKPAN